MSCIFHIPPPDESSVDREGFFLRASWSWHGRIWRWGRMLPAVALVAVAPFHGKPQHHSGGRSGSLWGALPPDERRSSKALPWLACVAQRSRCGLILMEQCGVAPAPWAQIKFPSQCQTKSRLEFGMFAAASSSVEYKAEEISINPPFQRWSRLVPLLKASQGTCIGVNSRCLLLELGCLLDFQLTGSFARMGAHLNTSM
ncbi:hypothetical protein U9M48_018339 [Paspalum notatum var. saurae]|uniref:Uncharacterized protein n=1 Tax=Paspalum notatum var. saurae TaxID=547442 RepID=A0AAQ3TAJ1_PASNO